MATKKNLGSLKEADLKGKRVFVRADLNVPLDDNFNTREYKKVIRSDGSPNFAPLDENPNITDDTRNIIDDTRIRAAVPTIQYLMDYGAKVILSSHLVSRKVVIARYQNSSQPFRRNYSLKPLVPRLSELLGIEVKMASDCIGEEVEKLVASLPEGGVLLLENVRSHKEEEENEPEFAKKLASLADLYVNDAFVSAYRANASTEGVAKYLKPAVAGLLMQKELDYLVGAVANAKKPFAAIVGKTGIPKIGVIESLLDKVDILMLVGTFYKGQGLGGTFYKGQGVFGGSSLVQALVEEDDKHDLATSLMEKAKAKGVSLLLPTDFVAADRLKADANIEIVPASEIPEGWFCVDIGPDSIKSFSEALDTTKTVIWIGTIGALEIDNFAAAGTEAIAMKLAELSGKEVTTIIGDTNSAAEVKKYGLTDKMRHVSTGKRATFDLLEGKPLPGILCLSDP